MFLPFPFYAVVRTLEAIAVELLTFGGVMLPWFFTFLCFYIRTSTSGVKSLVGMFCCLFLSPYSFSGTACSVQEGTGLCLVEVSFSCARLVLSFSPCTTWVEYCPCKQLLLIYSSFNSRFIPSQVARCLRTLVWTANRFSFSWLLAVSENMDFPSLVHWSFMKDTKDWLESAFSFCEQLL